MEIEKKFSYCGDYQILQTLGSGLFAIVKLASKEGRKVAIKILKNKHETAKNIQALANEINILNKLNHFNIINLIEFNSQLPYIQIIYYILIQIRKEMEKQKIEIVSYLNLLNLGNFMGTQTILEDLNLKSPDSTSNNYLML